MIGKAGVHPDGRSPDGRPSRGWFPFALLQVAEVVVAFVFVDLSVHVHRSGLLLVGAGLLTVAAVTARGPLGIVRICSPRLHVGLVTVLSSCMAVAPVIPVARPDVQGIIVVEFGALGLIRLATFTRTSATPVAGARGRGLGADVIEASAATVAKGAEAPPGSASATGATAPAGARARRMGRIAGADASTGRHAADRYGPEVARSARRSLRGAGRLTGRLKAAVSEAASPPDTEEPKR